MISDRFHFLSCFILVIILIAGSNSIAVTQNELNVSNISEDTKTIGLIPSGSTSPFHLELISGVQSAAKAKNWTILVYAPDVETNSTFQKDAMQTLIDIPVHLISLNTLDTENTAPEVMDAISKNIPVFLHNTLVEAADQNITEYIGYNQYAGAYEMGLYATRILAAKKNETPETVHARVFILRGLPGFHADQRTAGFIAGISQSPNITVVGEKVAGWDRETAKSLVTEALAADPDIDLFYGNSDEMAIGAALAVQEMEKKVNDDIFCMGIDGNTPTLDMIRNGTMTATLGVYPQKMGEIIIEQAEKVFEGKSVPLFLETPSIVVDKDNLDAYLNGSTWTGAFASVPEINNSEYSTS